MKNYFALKTFCALVCAALACASICSAQPGRTAGGYNNAAKTDEAVVDAADFAVTTRAKNEPTLELISVERAERQIVAGSNYRLCLAVNLDGKRAEATAVVYLNLQNEFALTSWTPGKCSGGGGGKAKQTPEPDADADDSVSYKGALEVGKTDSTILYLGEESGDYAAFCFANNSDVGRAILAACKNGEQCEFVGAVDFESPCKVKNLEADLSASGRITAVESVKSLTRKGGAAAAKTPAVSKISLAPDEIVKNLYAAQKAGASPFLQDKDRALVDGYFSTDFADLIWKDATTAGGEVGAIDGDPLYNAQETEITAFLIGKPQIDAGGGTATVLVSFKNFGKADTIRYLFERDAARNWKISDMRFQNGDMLKGILTDAQSETQKRGEFEGNYKVGAATCAVKPVKMAFEVKCGNQKQAKIYIFDGNASDQPMYTAENQGSFIFDDESLSNGIFIDAAGKKVKVSRVP